MLALARSVPERHRRRIAQFAKFAIVGGSGVAVNLLVAIVLHKIHGGTKNASAVLFGVPFTAYNIRFRHLVWLVAFLVANLWNFQLNRMWTFRAARHGSWWSQFWPFLAVGSGAAFAGIFVLTALTHPHSPVALPEPPFTETVGLRSREYWAQLITIFVTMPVNFVVNKLWTFRAVRHHDAAHLPIHAPVLAPDLVDEEGHIT